MPIHILSEQLAAQIAAGEVIERPSSVVKELIENAIDAGASEVRVEVRDGGKRLIRVSDNGSGIPSTEAELAFTHHATSKIESSDDLFALHTLGFRGEALPSIAAVAHVTMLTRSANEEVGIELKLSNGRVTARTPHAAPPGTVVTVENLFHNIPARLKFMKSTVTESGHIHELVSRYALAFPTIRFSLTSENRLAFQSAGNGSMADVLVAVYGIETAKQMLEIPNPNLQPHKGAATLSPNLQSPNLQSPNLQSPQSPQSPTSSIQVHGYISSPSLHRANRSQMVFFVNGRLVQDRSVTYAVSEAYHTLLPVGRYPMCILKIDLPADHVDVNVHPTKAEVKFREPHVVFSTVQRAVRRVLLTQTEVPSLASAPDWSTAGERPADLRNIGQLGMEIQRTEVASPTSQVPGPTSDVQRSISGVQSPPSNLQSPISNLQSPVSNLQSPTQPPDQATIRPSDHPTNSLPMLRVLGQVARTYIVAEGPEGIFLIDQHAAHERVLYERFQRERAERGLSTQSLLEPLPLELSPRQAALLDEQLGLLSEVGFQIEPFGGTTYLLRAVPSIMTEGDPRQSLSIILDEMVGERDPLHSGPGDPLHGQREAMLIASVCKQAAIKAGRVMNLPEMQELIQQLEHSESPRTCPHGRPTVIRLGLDQLAREFRRQ